MVPKLSKRHKFSRAKMKPIPHNPAYMISPTGQIWHVHRDREGIPTWDRVIPKLDSQVKALYVNIGRRRFFVSRLVIEAFGSIDQKKKLADTKAGYAIYHKDRDIFDNDLYNLKVLTPAQIEEHERKLDDVVKFKEEGEGESVRTEAGRKRLRFYRKIMCTRYIGASSDMCFAR